MLKLRLLSLGLVVALAQLWDCELVHRARIWTSVHLAEAVLNEAVINLPNLVFFVFLL